MEGDFRLAPEQASTLARPIDALGWALNGLSLFFTVLIFILIVTFALRYRRGRRIDREFRVSKRGQFWIEMSWIAVPLALILGVFYWGADLYFRIARPPADSMDVYVVGKQWMWMLQHDTGPREINTLHIPLGQPVRLNMISEDVIHSFYIPAFRTKMDVIPGRYTSTWFEASQIGTYHLFCTEYCGKGHSQMIGRVIVQSPTAYADWVQRANAESPEVRGQRVAQKYRCLDCHDNTSGVRAPSWDGLFGRREALEDGTSVVADAAYIRESILQPNAKIVAGFQADMPTFEGQISEEEIFHLIAYIRSLSEEGGPQAQQEMQETQQPQ